MTDRSYCGIALSLLAAVAMLTGCAHTAPARFYTLTASAPAPATDRTDAGPTVAVGPVRVAKYLDRQQILTRLSATEVDVAEFDRWAEPLGEGIARVLAQNLSHLLPGRAVPAGATAGRTPRLRVPVSVLALDTTAAGQVVLKARWSVLDGNGRDPIAGNLSTHRIPLEGETVAAAVSAQSRALQKLSEEIGAAITALGRDAEP